MKKNAIKWVAILCLSLVMYLSFRIINGIQQKKISDKNTKTIPLFSFVSMSGKKFSNLDLPNVDAKIVFNYFSPDCDHCQYMATQYFKNREKLKDILILMITIADSNSIAAFNKNYQLNSLANIILLRDESYDFYKIFGTTNVPSFFIYRNQKLVKKFNGETRIENLLD